MRKVIAHGHKRGRSNHGRQVRDRDRRGRSDDARKLLHDDFVGYEAGACPIAANITAHKGFSS
jgi:hypothetical protein